MAINGICGAKRLGDSGAGSADVLPGSDSGDVAEDWDYFASTGAAGGDGGAGERGDGVDFDGGAAAEDGAAVCGADGMGSAGEYDH